MAVVQIRLICFFSLNASTSSYCNLSNILAWLADISLIWSHSDTTAKKCETDQLDASTSSYCNLSNILAWLADISLIWSHSDTTAKKCETDQLVHYASMRNPPSFYLEDRMGWAEKVRVMILSEDLIKDSLLKMRQILEIREEHDTFVSYNVGMLMGRIREKYRFMSETYRDIVDSYHNATWNKPPGVRHYRPIHYILALERMHYLEIEIDKLVDVMVEEASRDLRVGVPVVGQAETKPPPKSDLTRRPRRPQLRTQIDIVREEMEKNHLRQRFLMKKLGNPTNMTTAKKRFLRNWPVEDSWSLDKYNHDYK